VNEEKLSGYDKKLSEYDKTEVIDISNIMQIYGYNHITITIKKNVKVMVFHFPFCQNMTISSLKALSLKTLEVL